MPRRLPGGGGMGGFGIDWYIKSTTAERDSVKHQA